MNLMFSDLPAFRRDTLGYIQDRGRSGSTLTKLNLALQPIYLVNDPAIMRQVLAAKEQDIDKGRFIHQMRKVVGMSSLVISGPEHRARRGVFHKVFSEGMAGDFVPEIGAVVRAWVASLARETTIDAHQVTAHLALRIVCSILFGRDVLSTGDEATLIEAIHLVEDDLADDMFRILPHSPWASRHKKRRLEQARSMMAFVVERTRKRATSVSLLRALERLGLEGEALRDEIVLLLIAGHHTTGTVAAWLLYHLAKDPALAESIKSEARRVVNPAGDMTALEMRQASTSRALVQEILRLYPSTYWTSRELQHDQQIAGLNLKRGTSLLIAPWHLHRDPRFWTDPEKLDLTRNWTKNPAYLPFGFGGRACVAMNIALIELQMIALEMASCYALEPAEAKDPGAPKASVTLIPPPIKLHMKLHAAREAAPRVAA